MATPPATERRQHTRIALVAQLRLRVGGEVVSLPVINLSAGGVLIDAGGTHGEATIGDAVTVLLADHDGAAPFAITGKIVRIDRRGDGTVGGLAVMWTSADAQAQTGLARLLDRWKGHGP